MKDELIGLLVGYGYPVIQQGSLGPAAYPATFFTFWNNSTAGASFYNNRPSAFIWDFDITLYSIDPQIVNTLLSDVRAKLLSNGWNMVGKGFDAASDEPTHTGRGIRVTRREKNQDVYRR